MNENMEELQLRKEFARCSKLTEEDNLRLMDAWVVENSPGHRRGDYLSLVKGKRAHFITLQNGNINTPSSGRFRTGLWFEGEGHISSFNAYVAGKNSSATFRKQVRMLSHTFREYDDFARIDFVPFDKMAVAIALFFPSPKSVVFEMEINHRTMWPENRIERECKLVSTSANGFSIKSALTETNFTVANAKFDAELKENILRVTIHGDGILLLSIGTRGDKAIYVDVERNIDYHSAVARNCVLVTPSFEMNKYFLWAKHDILELYSESSHGNGFFAGMPEFSWFFGRDGEWMSMAALECGLSEIACAHLDMLAGNAEGGRIPHEIPLVGLNSNQKYGMSGDVLPTRFMSADSSPLWIIAATKLQRWHNIRKHEGMLRKTMNFCISCDRDGDGLIENNFREGLIGWPESWSSYRDGTCIDVNAWWLKALEEYAKLDAEYTGLAEKAMNNYISLFFKLSGGNFTVFDSVHGKEYRKIKSPMEIVPAMYWKSDLMHSLVDSLSGEDMITSWGVRSMSSSDPMYDRGYHTGEVWPLMTGWSAIAAYKNGFPELGFKLLDSFPMLAFASPDPGRINETYHPEYVQSMGQFTQGWSSSMFIQAVIEGLFGIDPDGSAGSDGLIHSMDPHLPEGWESMELKNVLYRGKFYDTSVNRKGYKAIDSHSGITDERR
jgi:glycogen debranching enzyme